MSSTHDDDRENPERKEPSLKDALMPARPKKPHRKPAPPAARRETPARGEAPTLQDALLPADHRPSPAPASPHHTEANTSPAPKSEEWIPVTSQKTTPSGFVVAIIVGLAIIHGFIAVYFLGRHSATREASAPVAAAKSSAATHRTEGDGASEAAVEIPERAAVKYDDPGPMSLAAMQERGLIVDVHEHIASLEQAPQLVASMDKLGIQKTCLMGSSKFTLTLNESFGFTEYDENNEELLKIVAAYPGRFEAWPTVNPEDPEKLAKIQDLVARGATGVKLYIGHGYVTKSHTYMFHTLAMDDEVMLPLYAWCQENYIPFMLHVNPFEDKTGFAQEFIAVLTQYPDLKVIAPHFALSSVYNPRLEELLDTFPNLYSDVSFGDFFMAKRLAYMSKYPDKFRRIFETYPDRFMFAADLVVIAGRPDDWAPTQLQAYLDVLASESYMSPDVPGGPHDGLKLSDDLLSRILFRNYAAFRASRPSGTKITHKIDWKRMNQKPVERKPGQAFPPPRK